MITLTSSETPAAGWLAQFLALGIPPELITILSAGMGEGAESKRIRKVQAILEAPGGEQLRSAVGKWLAQGLSVNALVPDVYGPWRPLVQDAFQFLFTHLSAGRLAAKLVGQIELPLDTPPAKRLIRLIAQMPGIQKMGQVLARHRRLGEPLRVALSGLENGMRDAKARSILAIVNRQLGPRLSEYAVEVEPGIFSEASVSAVLRFTWKNPEKGGRERGVFKVLKPHVPRFFAEDLTLLQRLSEFIATQQGYGFATRHVAEMVSEVRLLLEHELDFPREQATLLEAFRAYRVTLGSRVPRLIAPLCTAQITAMTEESGVKVTAAFPGQANRRRLVAEQLVEALVSLPLLSRDEEVVFHADPHAGNLLYDERAGQVVILDWALTERLNVELRRHLTLLVIMTMLRSAAGVSEAILALSRMSAQPTPEQLALIAGRVDRFFRELPGDHSPGSLDAMQLLDGIALEGVRFPASLAMFQKALFTLDDVLYDIAGSKVSISWVMMRDFVAHLLASFGLDHPPLAISDLIAVPRSALLYPARWGRAALRGSGPDRESAVAIEPSSEGNE